MNAFQQLKQASRQRALARRRSLDPGDRQLAAASITQRALALGEIHRASSVFIYLAMDDEVSTTPMIDALVSASKQVFVPRLNVERHMEVVAFRGWDQLERGPMGIFQPGPDSRPVPPIDVVLTPGVAFSRDGVRLGFGAGYYDRWFATHPHRWRMGIAFACQLADELPVEPHDRPMHKLITENGVIAISQPDS
ncbi:MAG: 5-formyltetrahydrofolate cyclo-ligase [Gammaproteobacteria bacterium]|nr:5-formyltetrahydrofolate cyclo-ligase [Gammaproteobacteria bacterium]